MIYQAGAVELVGGGLITELLMTSEFSFYFP
jgi:hypothetical protein